MKQASEPVFPGRRPVLDPTARQVALAVSPDRYRDEVVEVRFAASTPSFWPSRRLLDQAAAGGSRPAPMGALVPNGSQDLTLTVRGSPRTVRADCFAVPESAWPDPGALLLVREGLDAVPLRVALSRGGGVEEQILALD